MKPGVAAPAIRLIAFAFIGAAGGPWECRAAADAVYVNGRIITLDPRERIAEAFAVEHGRISAVGTTAEIRTRVGQGTEFVDLQGKTVLPGLIETHCHSIGAARAELMEPHQELNSIAEIQEWLRRRAASVSPGTWIQVPRNEITRLKEQRFPTPEELDAGTTAHPVVFVSVEKSVFNTTGWRALGITDEAAARGRDIVFEDGRPVLFRGPGLPAGGSRRPAPAAPSPAELRRKLRELHNVYNSVGITSIFDRASNRDAYDLFRDLDRQDELTTRIRCTFRFSPRGRADVEDYVKKLGLRFGEGDDSVRATHLKIRVDGGIHWGTTWLSEPHGQKRTAFYRNADPGFTGTKYYTPEQMEEIIGAAARLGWPISAHVTGDGGTMAVLRALEAVAEEQPKSRELRFNLIHAYFPSEEIAALARKVNAGVDTQGYTYYRDADFIAKVYGQSWADRFIGVGTWAAAGVPVALNSDHMIGFDPNHAMNAFNPFLMLYVAVTRKDDRGRVHGSHQRLSRLDALRTVTLWAAWLSFDENKLGSLEPGKLADFVVIDRDYLTCPEEEIRHIAPLRTVLGGRTVFRRQGNGEAVSGK